MDGRVIDGPGKTILQAIHIPPCLSCGGARVIYQDGYGVLRCACMGCRVEYDLSEVEIIHPSVTSVDSP